jgi:hypothetical protein
VIVAPEGNDQAAAEIIVVLIDVTGEDPQTIVRTHAPSQENQK